jgi:transposase
MYLRRHSKKVVGEEYGYWSLVESMRTARGPRQRIVATIGKLPDYDHKEQIGREEIPWAVMVCTLVIARFCAPSSECLFYDITSTCFEGNARGNPQAQRGYSRDKRSDCYQVCTGLVASREGLPLAFEIFDGNRVDVTTTKDMIPIMESKYGKATRIWVMDRGMVSEDNLAYMRQKGARYLVGTSKAMLKKFEQQLLEQDWEEVQSGVEVRLCPCPDAQSETFVLCRSQGRREKENAILNRFAQNMETGLAKMGGPYGGRKTT